MEQITNTRVELINHDKLMEVIMCGNLPCKKSDEECWNSVILPSILLNIESRLNKNTNQLKTIYNKSESGLGRMYSDIGLQRINNEIKCYISGEFYQDVDIVNCHPVILQQILEKNGYVNKFLNEYTNDRELCIKNYNLTDKHKIIHILNNDQTPVNYHKDIIDFHTTIYRFLKNRFEENKEYYTLIVKGIKSRLKKQKKPEINLSGKLMAIYLQVIENDILNSMLLFFQEQDIQVDTLTFDGCMIQNKYPISQEILDNCCEYVKSNTGFKINLKLKSLKNDWIPIPVSNPQEAPLYNLKDNFNLKTVRIICEKYWLYDKVGKHCGINYNAPELIEYLNNFYCQFQDPVSYGFRNNIRDKYRFLPASSISQISKSDGINSIKYPSWPIWMKNIEGLIYDKIDFIVDFKNKDVIDEKYEDTKISKQLNTYNLYKRPESIHCDNIEIECKIIFDFLLNIICDSNTELYEFLLKWIAYILQNGKTGVAVILMGSFGTGKGTFTNILFELISNDYCFTDTCGNRVGSNFNSHEEGRLLCVLEELPTNNGDNRMKAEILKNKITDKESLIEKKGIDVYTSTNNCNYVMVSNGANPVCLEEGQRRYNTFKVSSAKAQDTEYFSKIRDCLSNNKFHLRDYFQNLPVNLKDMRVIHTKGNDELMDLNRTSIESFSKDFLEDFVKQFYKINAKMLHTLYLEYCKINRYTSIPTQLRYFKDFIKNKTDLEVFNDCHKCSWIINRNFKDTTTEFSRNTMDVFDIQKGESEFY